MKQKFLGLFILVFVSLPLWAQPDHYNFSSLGQSNSNPWNLPTGKKVQILYLPNAFAQPAAAASGYINGLSFMINQSLGPWTYADLTIRLGQTLSTALPTNGFYVGAMTTVYYKPSVTLSGTSGQWMNIPLDSTFFYDPSLSLVLEISHCGAPGATGFSACFTPVGNVTRCWSVGGCPFVYSTWSNQVYHMGITMDNAGTGVIETENANISFTNSVGQLLSSINIPAEGNFSFSIINLMGSEIYKEDGVTATNHAAIIVDTESWKSGVYLLSVNAQNFSTTKKLFIGN